MKRIILSVAIAAIAACSGCANPARYVVREPNGGIVAIPANTNAWPNHNRQHAEELMAAHYPAGYEIIREEEVVVGQSTVNNTQTNTERGPSVVPFFEKEKTDTVHTTSTSDRTEWRIYYRPLSGANFSGAPESVRGGILPTGATTKGPGPSSVGLERNAPVNSPKGDMLPGKVKTSVNTGN